MLSRIFWIGVAGIALVAGIVMQDGDGIFSWDDHRQSVKTERAIEARVERSVERRADRMEIIDADGRRIDVPRETRHALGEAVGRLVKAETHLAMLGIRDASDEEIQAAKLSRDQARAEVETLKAQIDQHKDMSGRDKDALREQIRQEIRDDVHSAVREALKD